MFRIARRTYSLFFLLATASASVSAQATLTETYAYEDDLTHWVIGQSKEVKLNGVSSVRNEYDSLGRLTKVHNFGLPVQAFGYYPDGNLQWSEDGNKNRTIYSSWERGIPRLLTFADGSKQSAVLDPNGWIISVTDQSNNTVSYSHDAMGRVTSVVYPTGDEVVWSRTTTSMAPVGVAEYGLAAGHWKKVVSTGSARHETYFDAFFRPVLIREYEAGANQSATTRFTRYEYDFRGQVTFQSYPGETSSLLTGVWTYYDSLGRKKSSFQTSDQASGNELLPTTYQYLSGNRVVQKDPMGHVTTTTFQAFDQPSYDAPTVIDVAGGARTVILRDVFGKPVSIGRSGSGS